MRQLWDQFYFNAVLAGLRHDGLRKTLIELTKGDAELNKLWIDFQQELDRVWAQDHPNDGTQCGGITCSHNPSE